MTKAILESKETNNESDDDDEDESMGVMCGRCCVWFITNHIDIPMFAISFIILYLSVN